MDFPIELDETSALPKYRQLSLAIGTAIQAGRLKPGDPLPTTRHIAQSLGMARGTVVRAYNELLAQGYLEGKVGTGTNVSLDFPAMATQNAVPLQAPDFNLSAQGESLSEFARRLINVPNVASSSSDRPELNYGCAPRDLLPVKQWRELMLSYCRPQDQPKLCYVCEPFGHRPLREAVAAYLTRTKAVRCNVGQVMIFSGPQQALSTIASLLINKNDSVIVENPGYVGAREMFLAHGAHLDARPVDQHGIFLGAIVEKNSESKPCKLIYVSPSGHDPSGSVLSAERRQGLLDFATGSGALIIEDAWDTDYRYGGAALPSLQGASDDRSVIYLYTFWKVLFPLTTVSVVIIPEHLIAVFTRAKMLMERQSTMLEYYALTDFINNGLLDFHITKTRKIYQKRRQVLIHALTTELRGKVSLAERSAGMHLMVNINDEKDEAQILKLASQADLPMVSTRLYYLSDYQQNQFLIPFANMAESTIPERIKRFAQLIG